ncbi:MAG: histidine kinase [Chloroflexota bacterium]|nr:histidine kinase [Chloroflexota bacterium]
MRISYYQDIPRQSVKAASSGGTARLEEVISSSGVTFHLWRLYHHAWLVCLVFPLVELLREPISLWHVALGLLALVGFAAGYTWLMWPHPASEKTRARTRSRLSFLLFGVLGALVLIFSQAYGPAWLWLFIGMSAIAGVLLPMRSVFAIIVLLTLLPLFLTLKMHGGMAGVDWWWLIAFLLLVRGIGLDMIGVARMGSAIRELHTARGELARLAVIEERLRLARDLHDLLGQTLSVITLKSELARGLVQEEPVRCAQELAEIEQVSRQMLHEVRKTVAGYRQPTLANELDGARQLLEAAGVEYAVEQTPGDLPPAIDATLAWIIREGVTNVIRHSHARRCLIQLTSNQGMAEAVVLNDGGRQEDQQDKQTSQSNGLSGLYERVAALGGMMEAGSLPLSSEKHFRLWVALPLQICAETGEAAGAQEKRT